MGVDCSGFCLCLRRIPYLSLLAVIIFVAASIILGIQIKNAVEVYRDEFNISKTPILTDDEDKILDCIEYGTQYLIIVTAVFVAIGIFVAFLETGPTRLKYCTGKWKKCCGLFWTDVLIGATFLMFLIWLGVAGSGSFFAAAVYMLDQYCVANDNNFDNFDLSVYGPVMGFAPNPDSTDVPMLCTSVNDLWNNNLTYCIGAAYAIVIAQVLFLGSHVANHSYLKLMTQPTETLEGLDGTAMSKM